MNNPALALQTPAPPPPWLDSAKAQLSHRPPGETQELLGSEFTLTLAIQLAEVGFSYPRYVRQAKPESPLNQAPDDSIQWSKSMDSARAQFKFDVMLHRRAPDAALKVGAWHALQQLLERLRRETGAEPGVTEVQRAICAPTDQPAALVDDNDPHAQNLDRPWVAKVQATLRSWGQRLGSLFEPEPWHGESWNRAWANATALTELDRLLVLASAHVQGEYVGRWDLVTRVLLNPYRPQPKFSTANKGTLTCLPTDKASALKVRLLVVPWLADCLDPGQGQPVGRPSSQALHSLRFSVSGLGDRSNEKVFCSNGLRVDHLYLGVFIQRLIQSSIPHAHMNIPHKRGSPIQAPAELPAELHDSLDPGEWSASVMGIAQFQSTGLAAHRAHPAGQTVRLLEQVSRGQARMKTRRALSANLDKLLPPLRALPADLIRWRASNDPHSDSLGSLWLSPSALNPAKPPQYTDCLVLVQHQAQWYVVRPELVQDGNDEVAELAERVGLWSYTPLPAALQEAGGWPVLVHSMSGACWVGHFQGLGLLLVAALRLSETEARGN